MQIDLSKRDIDYIGRVVETEVPPSLARTNPRAYEDMVKAVVDTVTNRLASDRFPNSVVGVLNQRRQFSKITGPSRLRPHGSVQKTPKAPGRTQRIVERHLAERAAGAPSVIGNALHYANPHHSDRSNLLGWINPMIQSGARRLGVGRAVHYHGNAPGYDGAPQYSLSVEGVQPRTQIAATSLPNPSPGAGTAARSARYSGFEPAGFMAGPPRSAPMAGVERMPLPDIERAAPVQPVQVASSAVRPERIAPVPVNSYARPVQANAVLSHMGAQETLRPVAPERVQPVSARSVIQPMPAGSTIRPMPPTGAAMQAVPRQPVQRAPLSALPSPLARAPVGAVERGPLPRAVQGPKILDDQAFNARFGTPDPIKTATPAAPPSDPASFAHMASLPAYADMSAPVLPTLQDQAALSPVKALLADAPPMNPVNSVHPPQAAAPMPPPAAPFIATPPAQAPVPPPMRVAAPIPTAPPIPTPRRTTPKPPPMPSGNDVWNGKADFGLANGGYEIVRQPDGTVHRYSPQFNRTDVLKPDGSFIRQYAGREDKQVGFFDNVDLGRVGRTAAGGILGGLLAGTPGALIGSRIGRKGLGGLTGKRDERLLQELERQARAARGMQILAQATGGAFPRAPRSPRGSDRAFDYDHARSISPAAADAIRDGKGGLF